MKILLAVDGSSYTQKMLAYLAGHGNLFNADSDFSLLTVHPPLPAHARSFLSSDVVSGYYAEESEKILVPAAGFLQSHGIQATSTWKVGPVGETIAQFGDEGKFDLLVMGSHGHGALASMVMGSVATQVLARSKVPLLLVP